MTTTHSSRRSTDSLAGTEGGEGAAGAAGGEGTGGGEGAAGIAGAEGLAGAASIADAEGLARAAGVGGGEGAAGVGGAASVGCAKAGRGGAPLEADIDLPDGRRLGYTLYGAQAGPVVVVLDGPASRGLARAAAPTAAGLGIRLVAPDRPGSGRSTPVPHRGIADWQDDHAALLDALGVQRAGILSQSGGTPYAIAAAARLPQRTIALASLGPVAPFDDPASVRELGGELRAAVKLARRAPWLLRTLLRSFERSAAKDLAKAARKAAKDLPPADARVLEDPAFQAIHEQATAEILAQPDAIAREIGLMARPWGIDPADVVVPVSFWSGSHDTRHPTAQARRLAASIPGNPPVHVVEDAAAFGLLAIYDDALRFATGG